jgi:undecaprenyl-diphosphatase
MLTSALKDLLGRVPPARASAPTRLLFLIVVGSIPAGVVGVLFNGWVEDNLRQPWLVAVALVLAGAAMLAADRLSRRTRSIDDLGVRDALLIGLAQAAALVPGVSRSGATISTGLGLHLDRQAAARFAFLLGTPAFVGAALVKSADLASLSGREGAEMAIGFSLSFLTGIVVIHGLLLFLRARSLATFVAYRWALGALTLIVVAVRG